MTKSISKAWGVCEQLLRLGVMAVDRITVQPQFRSSLHYHKYQENWFTVLAGELTVEVFDSNRKLEQSHLLAPVVRPLWIPSQRWHRFVNLSDAVCVAVEWYVAVPGKTAGEQDIVRFDKGGKVRRRNT